MYIMPNQCPTGVICIEYTAITFYLIIFGIIGYLVYLNFQEKTPIHIFNHIPSNTNLDKNTNIFNSSSEPPLSDNQHFTQLSGDVRGGIPINIKTRSSSRQHNYSQIGILTKENNNGIGENLILPLMGKINDTSRDKWNFYTISNTGSVNTKLPISVNGKNCSNEYGCDDIMNGDNVYVEGYNGIFNVTKYENNDFQYIPF